jgi:hypothetical protein
MKNILFAAIALFTTLTTNAQDNNTYKRAVGIRLGSSVPAIQSGISYKHFLKNNAIEGIISLGDGIAICGLYEIHKPINSVENLQWFIGGGGYVGFNNGFKNFGAAGIVGLDYKFANIPLNLSLDWKPELNLIEFVGFEGTGFGVSARFTF